MRNRFVPLLVIVLALATSSAWAEKGEIHLWFGQKQLDEDDWSDLVDTPPQFGLMSNWNIDLPVHLAVDLLYATDSATVPGPVEYEIAIAEVNGGVRKIWGDKIRPYLGGGLAIIHGRAEAVRSDSDAALGLWIDGGIYFRLSRTISLGLDARLSRAKIKLFDDSVNPGSAAEAEAGGEHLGLTLGFTF